jgi:hypothetical protein
MLSPLFGDYYNIAASSFHSRYIYLLSPRLRIHQVAIHTHCGGVNWGEVKWFLCPSNACDLYTQTHVEGVWTTTRLFAKLQHVDAGSASITWG